MKEYSPTSQELYQLTDPAGNIRPLVGTIEQIIEDLEWVAWKYSETDAGGEGIYIPPVRGEAKRTGTPRLSMFPLHMVHRPAT